MSPTTLSSLLLALSALCYLACGALIIQRLSVPRQEGGIPLRLMTFVAFVLHGAGLATVFAADHATFGLSLALSVTVFIAVAVFLVESIMRHVSGLMGVFLLCGAACAALPVVFPGQPVPESLLTPVFRLHLLFALSASSLILIAVIQAVLLVLVQHQLKNPVAGTGTGTGLIASMPDLLAMERILYRIVLLGFICLTILVSLALTLNLEQHGSMFVISHRFFMTLVSWAVFAILMYGRYMRGWRGRKALAWFWGGAASLALSYFVYAAVLAAVG